MNELTLRELQNVSLGILKDVHTFCCENNIKYSVAYGTLIGAIRHKGFIPWDDDVDIVMPRSDYDRFCSEYTSEKYKLECAEHTEDYYLAFARVFDTQNTVSETLVPWHKSENGVWIDIFPIDYVLDDFLEFEKYRISLQRKWRTIAWGRWSKMNFSSGHNAGYYAKLFVKKMITFNGRCTTRLLNDFIKSTDVVKQNHSSHWSQLTCLDGYEWHRTEDFSSTILMPFEDTEVMVMNGYDRVLRECFGDYMTLPPVEQRVGHSDGLTKFYWK